MFDFFGVGVLTGYIDGMAKALEKEFEQPRKKRQTYRDGKWVVEDYA